MHFMRSRFLERDILRIYPSDCIIFEVLNERPSHVQTIDIAAGSQYQIKTCHYVRVRNYLSPGRGRCISYLVYTYWSVNRVHETQCIVVYFFLFAGRAFVLRGKYEFEHEITKLL